MKLVVAVYMNDTVKFRSNLVLSWISRLIALSLTSRL